MRGEPALVLASGSPRRRQLLAGLGLDFTVRPADVDETLRRGEPPVPYVGRLARAKAMTEARAGELVLAADTIVALDREVLGKPTSPADARRMLWRLRGRWHEVITGVAVFDPQRSRLEEAVEVSRVRFAPMEEAEIDWYVASGEPMDKAGAYAIQGLGALFVESVEGNYSNVVGLPLPATLRLLRRVGYDVLAASCSDRSDPVGA